MPITANQVHLDVPLTQLTVAFMQETTGFVADKIFPRLAVDKQSDKYYIYDREDFNRDEMKKLAPGAEPEATEFRLSNDSYFADVYGLSANLTDQMLANEDSMLQIREAHAQNLAMKGMIRREKDWLATYFTSGVWNTEYTGVSGSPAAGQVRQWDDYTNSTPIEDVRTAQTAMQLKSGGFRPNKMLISREVMDVLIDHPDIIARISGGATTGAPALLNAEMLARVFAVDEVLVADGIENTAAEGASESNAFMAGKQAALYYAPVAPGLMVPAAGYNFTWTASELNASGYGTNILSFTDDALKRRGVAEQLQIKMAWDTKVVSADMGVFFTSVIG
jgi:hypothetical protein